MQQVLATECVKSPRKTAKIHRTTGDGETQCGKIVEDNWIIEEPWNRDECCKACFGNDDIFIVCGHKVTD